MSLKNDLGLLGVAEDALLHIAGYCSTASNPKQGDVTPIDSVQTPATGVKNGVKQLKPKIGKR